MVKSMLSTKAAIDANAATVNAMRVGIKADLPSRLIRVRLDGESTLRRKVAYYVYVHVKGNLRRAIVVIFRGVYFM